MILTVPSWLFPGTWLENLELAADLEWVAGVELLFFSFDTEARRTLSLELEGIRALSNRLSLSIHLPDPLSEGDMELVDLTAAFTKSYVLHPPSSGMDLSAWIDLVSRLRKSYGNNFFLEYSRRDDFEVVERALPDLPICADTGRLLLDGEDPCNWIESRLERVAEVHVHGILGTRDHATLSSNEPWLSRLAPLIAARPIRVEMEVFSLEGASASATAFMNAARENLP